MTKRPLEMFWRFDVEKLLSATMTLSIHTERAIRDCCQGVGDPTLYDRVLAPGAEALPWLAKLMREHEGGMMLVFLAHALAGTKDWPETVRARGVVAAHGGWLRWSVDEALDAYADAIDGGWRG